MKSSGNDEKERLLASSASEGSTVSSLKSYGSRGDLLQTASTSYKGRKESINKKLQKPRQYGFKDVFRYATIFDYVLMFFGLLFSIIHGAGFPILSVVFGGMTNTFLRAQVSNMTRQALLQNDTTQLGIPTTTTVGLDEFWALSPNVSRRDRQSLPSITMDEFLNNIITYSVYYSLIGAVMLVTSYAQIACFQSSAERQIVRIRNAFFHSVLRQEIAWYDQHQTGELTTRLVDDLERIREGMGDKVTVFVQNIAAFISGFVIGFIYDWRLTLVMMALTPVLAMSGGFVGKMMASATKREQEKYAKAGGIAAEAISCIRTVTSLNGEKREIQRYKDALLAGKEIGIQKYLYQSVGMLVTYVATFSSYALAFWYGSSLMANEPDFTPGTVFTVFFAVMGGSMALGNAAPHFSSVVTAKGAAITIFEIIDTVPPIDPYCLGGLKPANVNGKIEFHKVRFAYPIRKDVPVLNGISFKVEPGQNVAIVGASGCGKSTIVNLLLRFYDVNKGQVAIDGYNVKHMNVHWLRGMMGVVSQEPVLFDDTVEENIRLGKLQASRDEVMEAAKMANALQFISALPQGLDTPVGERGVQLSGGQKQRIAIARALVRDPKILLLDEATSALDAESEEIVQEALAKAQQGRTTITIAHRLSTIKDSDWIYVLQYGCLVEQGTHGELMEQGKVYYKMVMNQQLEESNGGYEAETEDPTALSGRGVSSANEGTSESKPVLRRYLSSRTGRSSQSDFHRSDSEMEWRTSVSRRRSSQKKRDSSSYALNRSLSRLESQEMGRLQAEMDDENVKPSSFGMIYRESRSEFGLMALGAFGCLLNALVMPAFAIFFSQIFNAYSLPGDQMQDQSLFWSMMFFALGATQGVGILIAYYFFGRAGENLTMNLRLKVFSNILRQDVAYFDDMRHSTGKICTRLASDAPNVRAAMGTRISFLLTAVISMILGIVVAFIFGWKLALVIVAMTPFLILAAYLDLRLQMDSHKRDTSLLEEAGKTATEAIGNIRTVQALCREHHFYITYLTHLKNPFREALKQCQLYALGFGVAQSVSFFMYAASFRYGGYLIANDEIDPVNVFRIFFAISFCAQSIGHAASFIPDFVKAKMSAGLLFYMMNYEPKIDNSSKAGVIPEYMKGVLNMTHVYFNYATRPTVRVLQNLSLNVKPGKTIALVGPSGCGKSTVISLIERFYDPLSGEIQLDGYDLRTLNLPAARSRMALVSQEPILFDCSIWDNIAYGVEDKVTHQHVVDAARLANIHDFILSLPEGYQTKVGEKGAQLSGGQKQRIAIARALVRNPKILLLDEATSALDTESERIVQEALDRAREGRTCVMIAHRLSTVQSADCIAVIQDGKVVEKGTHSELIATGGLYSRMTNMQNLVDSCN